MEIEVVARGLLKHREAFIMLCRQTAAAIHVNLHHLGSYPHLTEEPLQETLLDEELEVAASGIMPEDAQWRGDAERDPEPE